MLLPDIRLCAKPNCKQVPQKTKTEPNQTAQLCFLVPVAGCTKFLRRPPFVPDIRSSVQSGFATRFAPSCSSPAKKQKQSQTQRLDSVSWSEWRDLLRCSRSYTPTSAKTVHRTVFFRFAPSCSSPAKNKNRAKPNGLTLFSGPSGGT